MDGDVVLQAGHEGQVRNKGRTGRAPSVGTAGTTRPEHEMTPIVADAAAAILDANGVEVIRVSALFPKKLEVALGVALHFDGSPRPCASGASVGYPPGVPRGSNKPTADLWKEIWSEHWPFRWMKDNFTSNLSGYYGYGWMSTEIAEMLIEFGEISCPEQDAWLQPRLEWIGGVVAFFVGQVLGVGLPQPAPFGVGTAPPPEREGGVVTDPWDDDLAFVRMEIAELRAEVASLRRTVGNLAGGEFTGVSTDLGDMDHG